MRLIIDRFEGGYAVCEGDNKKMINILRGRLPEDAEEGSVLITAGGSIMFDMEETRRRSGRIKDKMNDLRDK